ncbi:MAG: hypothetical protein ABW068_14595 [Candidatus Thiodiazotropha sp.]
MEYQNTDQKNARYNYHELLLTRNILLSQTADERSMPWDVVRYAQRHSEVTYWEALLCAAFLPRANKLVAVVSRRQADGYSGLLRQQGSIEYVRFFVDWDDESRSHSSGLCQFRVRDTEQIGTVQAVPVCHLVSVPFEGERYLDARARGRQPKVRAILSWNQLPGLDLDFRPVFGNRVDSQISVDSEQALLAHFEIPLQRPVNPGDQLPCHITAG